MSLSKSTIVKLQMLGHVSNKILNVNKSHEKCILIVLMFHFLIMSYVHAFIIIKCMHAVQNYCLVYHDYHVYCVSGSQPF